MDQEAARVWLGVDVGARPEDMTAAYERMSRPLKRKLLDSTRAAEMHLYRFKLRQLVAARDAILGRRATAPPTPSAGRLLTRLAKTPILELDRRQARAFFGLPVYASEAQILNAYDEAARSLVRRFTVCTNDTELTTVHRARNRLRTIREIALA